MKTAIPLSFRFLRWVGIGIILLGLITLLAGAYFLFNGDFIIFGPIFSYAGICAIAFGILTLVLADFGRVLAGIRAEIHDLGRRQSLDP